MSEKTMIERITVALASAAMVGALAGCGGSEPSPGDAGRAAAPATPVQQGAGATAHERGDGAGVRENAMGEMEGMRASGGMQDTMGMEGMEVRIRPEQATAIGLRSAEARVRPLVRTVRTSAVIEYPESRMFWVSPKVDGWVERLHVAFEGAAVRAGEPLLDLYSPELVTAQEELLLARRLEEDLRAARVDPPADSLVEIARRRLRFWDIPDEQLERLLRTGEVTKTMTLNAPATGIVMKKQVFDGQGVKAGDNLFMIAPTDPVWVEAAVHEQDLPFVREGLAVAVTVRGIPGRRFQGQVTYLHPELRQSSRTVIARIEIRNPRGELRPGMYATAAIEDRTEPVLAVPASAVLHTGVREVVFMDMGDDRLMPMVVETGRAGDEQVEVVSGLEPGMRVATSAQFLIDSEANLMEAMRAMMVQMGRVEMEGMEDMDDMEGMDMPTDTGRDTTPGGRR